MKDREFQKFQESRAKRAERENAVPSTKRETTLAKIAAQKSEYEARPAPEAKPDTPPHVPNEFSVSRSTYRKAVEKRREWEQARERARYEATQAEQTELLKTLVERQPSPTPSPIDPVRAELQAKEEAAYKLFLDSTGKPNWRDAHSAHQAAQSELEQYEGGTE